MAYWRSDSTLRQHPLEEVLIVVQRLTKLEVDTLARTFIISVGERYSDQPQAGFFHLDYNGFAGGYVFVFTQADGHQVMPFGTKRRNSRQLADAIELAQYVWGYKAYEGQQVAA